MAGFNRYLVAGLGAALLSGVVVGAKAEDGERASAGAGAAAERGAGAWAYRTQLVLDGRSDRLARMRLRVWNPHPERDLEFYWEPTKGETLPEDGTVNGWGTLTWRPRGAARYDREAAFSTYRGRIVNGRPDGVGRLMQRDGLTYEGEWRAGLFHGRGSLTFVNGDQYEGDFSGGRAHGQGRYARADGEIYVGGFHNGRRHGEGVVTGPDGKQVAAVWSHGASGDRRATQWKPFASQDERVNLRRVSVGVMPVAKQGLTYEVGNNGIQIGPDKLTQRLLAQQGPITMFDAAPEGHSLIKLNIRVANANPQPVYVSGIYLDVAESVADNRPVIVIGGPNQCDGSQPDGVLSVRNLGWSDMTNVRFSMAFADRNGKAASEWFTKTAGRIGPRGHDFRFADVLAGLGVKKDALRRSHQCRAGQSAGECMRSVLATGNYGRLAPLAQRAEYGWIYVPVVGKITYNWQDATGGQKSASMPYKLSINLQHTYFKDLAECGGLPPYDPQAKRPPSGFRIGERNYRMNGNLSRNIQVGKARNFTFNLKAQQTSLHRFRAVVEFSDGGRKLSPWTTLSFFNPRK